MLDLERAPEPIGSFLDWLSAAGFRLVKELNRDCYNQYALYERDGVVVEFQVDRGDWSIALAAPGFSAPQATDVWEAYLDRFEPAGELSALEHQIDFIKRRMDETVRAAVNDSECEAKMKSISADWARRVLGITGYEQRDAEALRAAMPPRPKTRPLP